MKLCEPWLENSPFHKMQTNKLRFNFECYIPCYNIKTNEIFFCDFLTEKIIKLDEEQKNKIKNNTQKDYTAREKERNKALEIRLDYCQRKWEEIKLLSGFESYSNLTDEMLDYFRLPLKSEHLVLESLSLYSNHSSQFPELNNLKVTLKICIDFNNCQSEKLFDYLPKEMKNEQFFIIKQVSPLYVVDTLVKTSLLELKDTLLNKHHLFPPSSPNENNFIDQYEEMLSEGDNYQFVLKLKSYEEYLYGPFPIGTYESIKNQFRQSEIVVLFLYKLPKQKVIPLSSQFPPMIPKETGKEYNYYDLLDLYLSMYPKTSIIFRLLEPSEKLINHYLKISRTERKKTKVYGESRFCDYPFSIKINRIINLLELEKWLDNLIYNKNEMMLPYFEKMINLEEELLLKEKGKIFGEKLDKDKMKDLTTYQRTFKRIRKKQLQDENLQNTLNYLSIQKDNNSRETKPKKELDNKNNLDRINFSRRKTLSKEQILQENHLLSTRTLKRGINQESKVNSMTLFNLKFHRLPFIPSKIKINISMLYGSYVIQSMETNSKSIDQEIIFNEEFIFDIKKCLISFLPRETRLGINLICVTDSKQFVLGSAQIPIYDEQGFLRTGGICLRIWPNFESTPKISACSEFNWNFKRFNIYFNDKESEISTEEKTLKDLLDDKKRNNNIHNEIDYSKLKAQTILSQESSNKNKNLIFPKYEKENKVNMLDNGDFDCYCEILLEFPQIFKKIQYCPKTSAQYLKFIKEKEETKQKGNQDFQKKNLGISNELPSIEELTESSLKVTQKINESFKIEEEEEKFGGKIKEGVKKDNIFNYLEESLQFIVELLKKDPFTPITSEERKCILICRKYLINIPTALVLFLRAINWFNPKEMKIAHSYLQKWKEIEAEDAISLLDCKFPDTQVRQYAVNILRKQDDEIISLYILQISQCLLYENHLLNPLSEFLIEKSLKNPRLIGNNFFWNARVNMNNPLFRERLSILICKIFFLCGPHFQEEMFKKYTVKFKFQEMSRRAKLAYISNKGNPKQEAKESVKNSLIEISKQDLLPFSLPIDPTYYAIAFDSEKTKVFDSKMVPIKVSLVASDKSILNVMFKIGDDLRQDLLTLQIMKIMDKMWLSNGLDLNIFPYKVLPTELKAGFIEYVNGEVLDGLQSKESLGALDKELLVNYLSSSVVNPETGQIYEEEKQYDNFIRSLAGYCVATCVLGVADRHLGNVMIKANGVFFHIDFGHILGNFKYKFGIKRERAPFLLTPEMSNVYLRTKKENKFKAYCTKAFNILRHNANRLLNLIIIMSSAGMPEVCCMMDVNYVKTMLRLDLSLDEEASLYFLNLIEQSSNEKFRLLDNIIHNIKHG